MSNLTVTVRPMSTDPARRELAFVRETSLKVRWPRRNGISWNDWEKMHGPQVDAWLAGGETYVAESRGVLLGFVTALGLPDKLSGISMLYVKYAYRGEGIGLRLLAKVIPISVVTTGDATTIDPAGCRPLLPSIMPTPCWGKWCAARGLAWVGIAT